MSKISTYPSADNPLLLSDRLIGTEAIRPTPSSTPLATKNFSLGELLNLFSSEFPAASLQAVLNTGNSATQDINLIGEITATVIKPSNIEDTSGSQGTTFQFLSKGATSINWVDLPTYDLQSILDAGNTANQNIVLNGNITSTLIIPENIQDGLSSLGSVGQVLTKTLTGIEWSNISIPATAGLADVLSVGNTANNTITVNSFIKNGGTSEQILIADGSTQPLVLRELNEGNGIGYTISPSRTYFGNIGLRAVDFSRSSVLDSVNGATGTYSFASGLNVIASGYLSKSFGYLIDNGGSGSFDTGYNLKDRGWTNFLTGTGHDVTGTNVTIVGQAADIVVNSLVSYNVGTDIVFAVGNGTIADGNSFYPVTSRSTALLIRKNGQAEFKYDVTANSFKKIGGLSTQYLMADGSVTTGAGGSFVPYTGATGNVDLGEWELKAGQISLDLSPTGTASVGTTRWNNSAGVSETTLEGGSVVLKNGVDLVARVVNKVTPNTTLTKSNYNAVKISGAQGQRLAIAYAQADNDYNSADTIGLVCETIATNQEGFIITVGQLEEINTSGSLQGESWNDGDVLYLSPTVPGAITNIKPTAVVGHLIVIGYVEYAHAVHGKIYVKIMNGWELDELHNVYINPTTLSNNDGLFYESSSMLWKNKTIADVLGYTPANIVSPVFTDSITVSGAAYATADIGSNPHQLVTKEYVDNVVSAGLHIHEPVLVESDVNFPATYANGGTTPTVTAIASNSILTSVGHGLAENDMIIFNVSGNGITAGDTYFVFQVLSPNTFNISLTLNGPAITTLTNGAGLSLTSLANSGVGATLTNAGAQSALVISAVAMTIGDRVLINGQAVGYQNGVYTVTNIGSPTTNWILTRATDANKYGNSDPNALGGGDYFFINAGIPGAGESYVITNTGEIVFGTTTIIFTKFSAAPTYSGTAPINVSGQIISISKSDTSTDGYLSFDDWNTFSSKQNALSGIGFVKISGTTISYDNSEYYLASNPDGYTSNTGTITGTGDANYLPKFTGASSLGNSLIYDDGASILIGTTVNDGYNKLQVNGGILISTLSSLNANNARTGVLVSTTTNVTGDSIKFVYPFQSNNTLINDGTGGNNLECITGFQANSFSSNLLTTARTQTIGLSGSAIRKDPLDISTSTSNTLVGASANATHQNLVPISIVTGIATGGGFAVTNNSGIMTTVYGVRSTISLASVNTALTSSMTSVYGFHSMGSVGSATGGTGIITNYYGLYLSPLTIGATGSVTNRWGLYLPDPLMKNHIVGTTLIGTAVDNGIDKLQVSGYTLSTGFKIPSGLSTQFLKADGSTSSAVVAVSFILGDTGTDINSSVATSTTTPAITLNVPTASALNRGLLSSADWITFNAKQDGLSGTGFIKISGTTISYDNSVYLTSVGISDLTATGTPSATTYLRGDNTWATISGGGAPGGTVGEIQYNDGAGGFAGAANVEVSSGNLKLVSTTDPATPTGGLIHYAKVIAGRVLPKIIGPSGIDTVMQVGLHGNSVFMVGPANATTAPTAWGGVLTTATTISHQQTIASANPWQATRRTRFQTSTTAGNASGMRTAYVQWFRGSAAGFGGFWFRAQLGMNINLAGGQKFVGLCASTGALAGEPSALLNMCGMGYDSTDLNTGNWFFMYNDGTSTATKVDLGANAVRSTTAGYDLIMYMAPGGSELFVRIVNLATNVTVLDTSYTTLLPVANTGMAFKAEVRNGAVAAADNLEVAKVYIETDY